MWNQMHQLSKTKECLKQLPFKSPEMVTCGIQDGHMRKSLTAQNKRREEKTPTAFLTHMLWRSVVTKLQQLAKLPLHLLRVMWYPALWSALSDRELHRNALSVGSASFTSMNSWSISGCTPEKTLTSALSVGKLFGGALIYQVTGGHSAEKQRTFASNAGKAFSLCRKNVDTSVFIASTSLTVLTVGKVLRKCTCWLSTSWLTTRTAFSHADSAGRYTRV